MPTKPFSTDAAAVNVGPEPTPAAPEVTPATAQVTTEQTVTTATTPQIAGESAPAVDPLAIPADPVPPVSLQVVPEAVPAHADADGAPVDAYPVSVSTAVGDVTFDSADAVVKDVDRTLADLVVETGLAKVVA